MKRQTAHLSESLSRRLNSYALAAGAAGVSLLALAQPTEAKIIYTKTYKLRPWLLDVNNDGIADFKFRFYSNTITSTTSKGTEHIAVLSALEASGGRNYIVGSNDRVYVSALPPGVSVRSAIHLQGLMAATQFRFGSRKINYFGPWVNVKNRYLGLKFAISGKYHFGWARLKVRIRAKHTYWALTGYAYETVPNKPIITGKTNGPDVITLQDPSLGHLARGASAIPAWRGSVTTK